MLIRLISLAILLLLIDTNHISLTDENFILPKDKPSVFKKIEKPKTTSKGLLPQSKPIIKTETIQKKEEVEKKVKVKVKEEEKIVKKMDKLDKASKIIQAVNCVTVKNNKYYGSNTDWLGFGEALLNSMPKQKISIQSNSKVILIGYGGAAKAILYNLSLMGVKWRKNTLIFNRSKRRINI